jgi:hypothetical protein
MEWVIFTVILLGGYLAPSIIAIARKAPSSGSTIVINILLGWTLLGWAVAMAMALRSHNPATVVHVQQTAPGLPTNTPPVPPETPTTGGRPIE